jgi:hypothetical protein
MKIPFWTIGTLEAPPKDVTAIPLLERIWVPDWVPDVVIAVPPYVVDRLHVVTPLTVVEFIT